MKLIELLKGMEEFDGRLIVKDAFESRFGFCWGNDTTVTAEGLDRFRKMLNSEIKIDGNVIILLDETIEEDEYDFFMSTFAGFGSAKDYDRWFKEEGIDYTRD
ncbi:hypothetical protein GQ472_01840 [archaeon]|nr:hypothetical protein [archaeon]